MEHTIAPGSAWASLSGSQWREIIIYFYNLGDPIDPATLVLGEPASREAMDAIERNTGLPLPLELRDFYGKQNGFGLKRGDGSVAWLFVPIESIPQLTGKTRKWFMRRHPEMESRILTFADWDDGESVGYLFSESHVPLSGVYSFRRESESVDKEQYGPVEISIYNLLTEGITPSSFLQRRDQEVASPTTVGESINASAPGEQCGGERR